MATSTDFIEYVRGQLDGAGVVQCKKMFGEYLLYIDEKPVFLVCDNTAYVKMLPCLAGIMRDAELGFPYVGAKEHYILNVDDAALCRETAALLVQATPLPKHKKAKAATRK